MGQAGYRRAGEWGRRVARSDVVPPLVFAAALAGCLAAVEPKVLSARNLSLLGLSALPLLVLAVGQLVVLVAGGIDLSVAAVAGLASAAGGLAMARDPAAAAGVGAMLGVGLLAGAGHGAAVAGLRMPAFLVTLATAAGLGGAAVWATRAEKVTDLPDSFLRAGWRGDLLGLPAPVWVAAGVAGAAHLFLARTVAGRQLYAAGLNPAAARVAGVPVGRRVALAFAASGVCTAVAAAMLTARQRAADPTLVRADVLLDVLGAAVVGGASLRGGRGTVPGVAAGVLVIALIGNGLTHLGLDHWHVVMAKGGLIFLAAGLDRLRTRGGRGP